MALINPNFAQAFQGAYQAVPGWQQSNLIQNQAGYLGQEALAKNLENQQTMMMMPMFQKAIQEGGTHPTFNTADGATPTTDLQVGDATNQATKDQDPALATGNSNTQAPADLTASMEAYIRTHANKYAPVSMAMDPKNAAQYNNLQMMGKANPKFQGMADGYRSEFEAHQSMVNQMNQIQAEKAYMNAMGVYRSDDSHIRESLEQADPEARNNPQLTKLSPAQLREYAGVVAGSYFPYTGRPMGLDPDGYHIDSKSGWKVPGARSVGLKPEDYQKAVSYWSETAPYTIGGETRQVERWIGTNESRRGLGMAPAYLSAQDAASKNIVSTDTLRDNAGQGVDQQGNPVGAVTKMVTPGAATKSNVYRGYTPDPNQVSVDLNQFTPNPAHVGQYGDVTDPDAKATGDLHAQNVSKVINQRQLEMHRANENVSSAQNILRLTNDPNTAVAPGVVKAADIQNIVGSLLGPENIPHLANLAKDPANILALQKFLNGFGLHENLQSMSDASASARFSNALAQTEMTQLAANVNQNKGAINKMVKWELGDSYYDLQKWGGDYQAALKSKKIDMAEYPGDYETAKSRSTFMQGILPKIDQNGNIREQRPNTQTNPAATPNPATANMSAGTVAMISPDGKRKFPNIPIDQVPAALKAGLIRQ